MTGKILGVVDHPDSDHLKICQLDVGKEELRCRSSPARNVTPASVARSARSACCVHPAGRREDHKERKLRGVPSNGMMCSRSGAGSVHGCVPYACENGILFLPASTPVGEDIKNSRSGRLGFVEIASTVRTAERDRSGPRDSGGYLRPSVQR